MRIFALAMICLILPLSIKSGQHAHIPYLQVKNEFGISLCPGANSSLYNYGIVTKSGNQILKTTPLTEQSFMMQIMGKMNSTANPKMKNLLKEHVKDTCECLIDDLYKKYYGYKCYPITILWKLRYKYEPRNHAYKQYDVFQGWAVNQYAPSEKQSAYLMERYKIKSLNDYITGENLYQLIKDVQDTLWIEDYKIME